MDAQIQSDIPVDWATRAEHWRSQSHQSIKPRGRRERRTEPLVLCGHGASLRIDGGALVIREGRTHHPQQPETWRFFRGDLALPPRLILLGGSGSISFDVLDWLAAQSLPLIRLSMDGSEASLFGGGGYAADTDKVMWQETARTDPKRRLEFSTGLIRDKLANSIVTLDGWLPPSKMRDAARRKAEQSIAKIDRDPPGDLTALRLMEATNASAYFAAWRALQIRWIGTSRKPIPGDWRTFNSRTSLANNGKLLNVNASHPVNAILNLSYAVLEANLKLKVIAEGYDPTIGIMHHGRRGKSAFVFDLMEPERPNVDAAVLNFLATNRLAASDFAIRSDGVVRLAPSFATMVCSLINLGGCWTSASLER
jgi:CRISPR-associated endonuclease Cas1